MELSPIGPWMMPDEPPVHTGLKTAFSVSVTSKVSFKMKTPTAEVSLRRGAENDLNKP